jgi:hypothetical protein
MSNRTILHINYHEEFELYFVGEYQFESPLDSQDYNRLLWEDGTLHDTTGAERVNPLLPLQELKEALSLTPGWYKTEEEAYKAILKLYEAGSNSEKNS